MYEVDNGMRGRRELCYSHQWMPISFFPDWKRSSTGMRPVSPVIHFGYGYTKSPPKKCCGYGACWPAVYLEGMFHFPQSLRGRHPPICYARSMILGLSTRDFALFSKSNWPMHKQRKIYYTLWKCGFK